MARLKLAVLATGRGSNLQAIIDACRRKNFPAKIVLVFSNNPKAYALERAEAAGIATAALSHKNYPGGRVAFDREVSRLLAESGAELIVLAGYLRLLSAEFVGNWVDRMINIHPSLLPAFKGLRTHEQVLEAGVKYSGCTVHYVVPEMDAGPVIAQAVVPVFADDTPATLGRRVLREEHKLLPMVIGFIAGGRVRISGAHAIVDGAAQPDFAHQNPTEALPKTGKHLWRRWRNG